jgi:hypothetical protein
VILYKWSWMLPVPKSYTNANNVKGTTDGEKIVEAHRSWLGPPPRSSTIPRIINPTIVMTLIELRSEGFQKNPSTGVHGYSRKDEFCFAINALTQCEKETKKPE